MITVPVALQYYVDRLRIWLGDTPELNKLLQIQESSDEFLYVCILDTVDEINNYGAFKSNFSVEEVGGTNLPWFLVKQGATLQMLIGKGILSARNVLTYQDAGGVMVTDMDVYGRYINYFNLLVSKYNKDLNDYKTRLNVAAGFGEFSSQLRQDWWTQW